MRRPLTIGLFFGLLLVSCGRKALYSKAHERSPIHQEAGQALGEMDGQNEMAAPMPTSTRIRGRIVGILTNDGPVINNICAEAACEARVEVIQLLNYGSDYHGQVEPGMTYNMHFDYTLNPTQTHFPNLDEHLPGLDVGDEFEADLITTGGSGKLRIGFYRKTFDADE